MAQQVEAIANTLKELGQIQGQGIANQGQILGGTLASLGQIPGQIQQAKAHEQEMQLRQQELQIRQTQVAQAQKQQQAEDLWNHAIANSLKPDNSIDFEKLGPVVAQNPSLVPHWQGLQDHLLKTQEQAAKVVEAQGKVRDAQAAHAATLANAADAAPDPETKAATLLVGLVQGAQSGAIESQYAKQTVSRLLSEAGTPDPQKVATVITQMKQLSSEKGQAIGTGGLLLPGGRVVPPAARPLAPGAGNHVVNGQLIGPQGERIGEPVPPQREPATKGLQSENVLLNGKPAKVNFHPDTGVYTDASGADVSAKVKPMPPASVVYPKPEAGNTPEIILKPGTQQYRVAQDVAYGTLTMADFNRIYGRAMGNAATKQAIYDTARQLNPDFNPAQFELGFKIAGNPQIRQRIVAIDGANQVINKIEAISSQVGNGDVQLFNKLLQGAKLQISNKPVANFNQLRTLLGDELGIALGVGTGSDLKTKLGLDLVNTSLSDGTFQSNMEQAKAILGGRKDLLLKQMGPYAAAAGGDTATPANGAPPPGAKVRKWNPALGRIE